MLQNRTGLPRERACAIALDVARALVGLHERGIVHRDIKPGNVVVTPEGRARLLDFGLAYATGDGWEPKSPDLTEEGHAPGTPVYMSPEQATHARPSPAFDIYAFGVMLYELLSGNPPHDSIPLGALLALKCDPSRQPFPIAKMCPGLPPHVTDLVDRCLAHDPAQRPAALELVATLDNTPAASRATPTELRLVPIPRASVIADGARPAGDETRADIVRKAIPLPSVKRAAPVAGATEVASAARAPARAPQPEPATVEPSPKPSSDTRGTPAVERSNAPTHVATSGRRRRWTLPLMGLGLAFCGAAVVYAVHAVDTSSEPGRSARSEPSVEKHSKSAPEADSSAAASASQDKQDAVRRPALGGSPADAADPPTAPEVEPRRPPNSEAPASEPPRKRLKPGPRPAAESSQQPPSCEEQREHAGEAGARKKWSSVLALTKDAACWSDAKSGRARLRVEALMRLGRYKACAKEAFRSADPTVAKWGEECFRRAENPGGPEGGGE
jgi:serine/threonine-protein kinase